MFPFHELAPVAAVWYSVECEFARRALRAPERQEACLGKSVAEHAPGKLGAVVTGLGDDGLLHAEDARPQGRVHHLDLGPIPLARGEGLHECPFPDAEREFELGFEIARVHAADHALVAVVPEPPFDSALAVLLVNVVECLRELCFRKAGPASDTAAEDGILDHVHDLLRVARRHADGVVDLIESRVPRAQPGVELLHALEARLTHPHRFAVRGEERADSAEPRGDSRIEALLDPRRDDLAALWTEPCVLRDILRGHPAQEFELATLEPKLINDEVAHR